ncbi:hypothetical protein SSX86_032555 [Deinandra increscens subsp. villosa]|uniref:RRM domain-containing protein n=1 Tax=Deinandra increscens subsp. villosa TaxID=3103831 RepID=A0AAP0GGR0_9ASTR
MSRERNKEREKNPNGEDWQQPSWKKDNRRGEHQGSRRNYNDANKIIFYISNFPEDCSIQKLKGSFSSFGLVSDVYISKKRNCHQERFGFVKYSRLDNRDALDNVKIGNLVLTVNPELFDRDRKPVNRRNTSNPTAPPINSNCPSFFGNTTGSRSYASAVGKGEESPSEKCVFMDEEESEASKSWRSNSLVGRATNLSTLNCIQDYLNGLEAGCIVRYIGGLCVLLSFQSADEAKSFLSEKSWWERKFSSLEEWGGQFIPFERIACLDLVGIPPHLWGAKVFNIIGGMFGVVVKDSDADDRDFNLAKGSAWVLTSERSQIKQMVVVCVNGKKYRCCVRESQEWSPEFITGIPLFHVSQQEEKAPNASENFPVSLQSPEMEEVEEGEILACMEEGESRGYNDDADSMEKPNGKPYESRDINPDIHDVGSDLNNNEVGSDFQNSDVAGKRNSDSHNGPITLDASVGLKTPMLSVGLVKEKNKKGQKTKKRARVQSVSPTSNTSGPTKPSRKKGSVCEKHSHSQEADKTEAAYDGPSEAEIVREVIDTMNLGPVVGMNLTDYEDVLGEVVKSDSVKSVS